MKLKMLKPAIRTLGAGTGGHGWKPDALRGTAAQRGYGYAWQKLRERILVRDDYLCQTCKRAGRVTAAAQVDHVIPKAQGGTDDESNLEAICKPCHKVKSSIEGGYAKG